MTDQPQAFDLDAIEARANNAPSGPWFTHGGWPGRVFSDDEFNAHIARVTGTRANASAEFIAAARTDVPALVADIRRLTAERDRYRDAWRNARTRARDSAADESMWRRIVTSTEQGRDRVIADNDRLAAELQQARQQTADRIAVELATIDPPEWALAGQYGGQDAIRIARAVGTGCDCENADQPGHYIDHLTTAPRVTECRGPHPVAEHSCCQLPAGHDGWRAADVGSWPSSN